MTQTIYIVKEILPFIAFYSILLKGNASYGFPSQRTRSPEETLMTRYSIFDSPLLLGFDHLERMVERAAKNASSGYPPYNIEQIGETGMRITLAVAGFTMDQLQVSLEDKHLVIRGRHDEEESANRVFVHRGIATRQFQRVFLLADEIEIKGAHLDNGLLHIDLMRLLPEKKIQNIAIQTAPKLKNKAMEIDGTASESTETGLATSQTAQDLQKS
jgi:HSP20 family molecular chaperone IbpA